MPWLKEHDDELRQARADGLSFSDCQARINRKFDVYHSRNACIGRARRLGLGESIGEIRLRRSQSAVQREEIKRHKSEERAQRGLTKVRRPCKRGRNGISFEAAPSSDMEITGISPLKIKSAPMPVGSIASRVVQSVKKIEQDKAQADRKPRSDTPQLADDRPLRCAEVEPLHVALMDLKPESCRYPYGGWPSNDPITFCGHLVFGKVSYCPAHQRLAVGGGTYAERTADKVSARDAA